MPAQLKRRLLVFFTLVAVIALAFLGHWHFKGRFYESTDNATGNFTQVVQRIPVKLTFRADNPLHGRIRPGMSVTATVDLRNEDEGRNGR